MLLFFISLVMVLTGSFLIASVFEKKNFITFFIYFVITAFANIVLTMEVLSLITAMGTAGVLVMNFILFSAEFFVWLKFGKPLFSFKPKMFIKRLCVAFKHDKYLAVLSGAVLFMVLVSLFLISFLPVVNPDAESYHVLRSLLWVFDKKISHVQIADARNLVMPINSELLYAWVLMFVKKQVWFGIFSFCGYVLSIVSLWGILSRIGIEFKRRLWTVCILSSFASVIVQVSATETDIIISGLILASVYLFMRGVNENLKLPVIMAALAYALAVGTKTPAIMMIPGVGISMLIYSVCVLKRDFYRPLLLFCGSFVLMFLLLGSYNYILNFIAFGDIAGSKSMLAAHKNFGGIKAACSNFIKYLFMFFSFTGFALHDILGPILNQLRDGVLIALGLANTADGVYSTYSVRDNVTLLEPLMGLGVLGFLVYLPCWIAALVKPLFTRKKQDFYIMAFAFMLLAAIWVMSCEIVYMTYSVRFLTSFCIIASPVLVYSYFKKNNIYKFIVVFFALFYLIFLSTHLWARPALVILRYLKHGSSISDIREIAVCSKFNNHIARKPDALKNSPITNEMCIVRNEIRKYDKRNKILFFSNSSDGVLLIKLMNYKGYNIDFDIIEDVDKIDFSKYNLILTVNEQQNSTNVKHFDDIISGSKYYKNGITCSYFDTKQKELSKNALVYPYVSSCKFEEYFYRTNNFKQDRLFTIKQSEDGNVMILNYKFYENQNNPVIR